MPKFEAKKKDFAKKLAKTGGGGGLHRPWCFVYGLRRPR